jgi:hypothetical protein
MTGSPWGALGTERRFVLTSDQDWAPEWAVRDLLDWARGHAVPLHVFQTNPSPGLDEAAADGLATRGWHPNFGPGSTHGDKPTEVVARLEAMLPGVRSARTHGFHESFHAMQALHDAGIRYVSQFPSAFSGHLVPSVHATGLIQLPVWFEDDVWMRRFPNDCGLDRLLPSLRSPGLKIMNVHAIHLSANAPSMTWYDDHRNAIYAGGEEPVRHPGSGIRDVLDALVAAVSDEGESWHEFESTGAEAGRLLADRPDVVVT